MNISCERLLLSKAAVALVLEFGFKIWLTTIFQFVKVPIRIHSISLHTKSDYTDRRRIYFHTPYIFLIPSFLNRKLVYSIWTLLSSKWHTLACTLIIKPPFPEKIIVKMLTKCGNVPLISSHEAYDESFECNAFHRMQQWWGNCIACAICAWISCLDSFSMVVHAC